LHLAALAGSDECVELLMNKLPLEAAHALCGAADSAGNTPLHAAHASPLASFDLASAAPGACLARNAQGLTPVDLAAQRGCAEVLNALLLACSGSAAPAALASVRALADAGAVPDTWAPNGQSALMLAAAGDSAEGVGLLLERGASLELQDSLGRTALMWAAGSGATAALLALLDAGAAVAQRDRRGRAAAEYAAEFPATAAALGGRMEAMEARAAAAQEALLRELNAEEEAREAAKASKKAKKKERAKSKKKPAEGAAATADDSPPATPHEAAASDGASGQAPAGEPSAADAPLTPAPANAQLDSEPSAAAAPAPPSPEWHTVGKGPAKAAAAPKATPPPPPAKPASAPVAEPARPAGGGASISAHHRCHSSNSLNSLGSSCSGESHDSEGSVRHSGSERSVLRRPSGGALAAPAPHQPPGQGAWGKAPPAAAATPAAQAAVQPPAAAQGVSWATRVVVGSAAPPAVMRGPAPAGAAAPAAAAQELAALRAELERARRAAAAAERAHHEELAAVLQDAARHEADAVARAVADERLSCVVRFASFLQSGGTAAAAAAAATAAGGAPQHEPLAGGGGPRVQTPTYAGAAAGAAQPPVASGQSAGRLGDGARAAMGFLSARDLARPAAPRAIAQPAASQAGSLFGALLRPACAALPSVDAFLLRMLVGPYTPRPCPPSLPPCCRRLPAVLLALLWRDGRVPARRLSRQRVGLCGARVRAHPRRSLPSWPALGALRPQPRLAAAGARRGAPPRAGHRQRTVLRLETKKVFESNPAPSSISSITPSPQPTNTDQAGRLARSLPRLL
jgi:hypothetical protein